MPSIEDAFPNGIQIHLKCHQCALSLWTEIRDTFAHAGIEAGTYEVLHLSIFPDHYIQMWAMYLA